MKVYKGEVIYPVVPIHPPYAHVQGGMRPYVVVSNDIGNYHSNICLVVPLTTAIKKDLPTHAAISGLRHETALCEQVFTISQDNVSRVVRKLPLSDVRKIERCLKIAMGIEQ